MYSLSSFLKKIPALESACKKILCSSSTFVSMSNHEINKNKSFITKNVQPSFQIPRTYSTLIGSRFSINSGLNKELSQLQPVKPLVIQNRSVTLIKFSKEKGRKLPMQDVIQRFKRLDWGIWIRPKSGADKQLWRKKGSRIRRIKQNVFCNRTQSRQLDIMVTKEWRTPRVYADDPYRPYHTREDYHGSRKLPRTDY